MKVDVTVDVGSTILAEQPWDNPVTATAGAVPTSSVPLSMTDVMISLATAYAAATARGTMADEVMAGVTVTVSVTITRVVARRMDVLAALVVMVLQMFSTFGREARLIAYIVGVTSTTSVAGGIRSQMLQNVWMSLGSPLSKMFL